MSAVSASKAGRLQGKVAVITGGTQGIGRATALKFLEEGARVVVTGRSAEKGAAVIAQLEAQAPGRARFIAADCGQKSNARRVIDEALNGFGRLDILINNAQTITPWRQAEEDVIDGYLTRELGTGTYASLWLAQAAFPAMRDQGGGVILNMGSGSSDCGLRYGLSYNANKEALKGITRTLANEWGKYNIRVNIIMPAAESAGAESLVISGTALAESDPAARKHLETLTETLKYQQFTMGQPEQVALVALGLASDTGRFLTGQVIYADGGLHLWGLNQYINYPGQYCQTTP